MSKGEPTRSAADTEKLRQVKGVLQSRDVRHLIKSASGWMNEAMNAWSDDDYGKVALLAPLAVEHLGKALLWRKNPVLVVPLSPEAETSLLQLATTPTLADPKLRTVGLRLLLNRIDTMLGGLPLPKTRRDRMVEVRNGAMHIASSETSRHVLTDAITLCNVFLDELKYAPDIFYGAHQWNAKELVAQGRSEVEHRVAQKRAHARRHLTLLEERLGQAVYQEMTNWLEDDASRELDDEEGWAIDWNCPECGSRGRISGPLDLSLGAVYEYDPEMEEPTGETDIEWEISLNPFSFGCNVCRLTLSGRDELRAGGVPSYSIPISSDDLGPDFDPAREAERLYGLKN